MMMKCEDCWYWRGYLRGRRYPQPAQARRVGRGCRAGQNRLCLLARAILSRPPLRLVPLVFPRHMPYGSSAAARSTRRLHIRAAPFDMRPSENDFTLCVGSAKVINVLLERGASVNNNDSGRCDSSPPLLRPIVSNQRRLVNLSAAPCFFLQAAAA